MEPLYPNQHELDLAFAELSAVEPGDIAAMLAAMRNVKDTAEATAKEIALDSVRENTISQTHAAERLRKHPTTISRWLTATEVQTPSES